MPSINEVNQYGDTYDGKSYCIGQWSEQSGEAFWDIKHHPYSVSLNEILTTIEHNVVDQRKLANFDMEHE